MKRKLLHPPIENNDYSPLADIEGLVELEPEDGCFTSSRMRDEYLKSKGLPPHTRKPRQGPIVERKPSMRKQLAEKHLTSDGQSTSGNQEIHEGIVTQNVARIEKGDNQG